MVVLGRLLREAVETARVGTYTVSPSTLALRSDEVAPDLRTKGNNYSVMLMLVEMLILKLKSGDHSARYRFNDTVANLCSGLSQQAFTVAFLSLVPVSKVYKWLYKHYRIVNLDVKKFPKLTWLGLLLGVDLAFYWAHRICHEVHVLWAGHSVHHSGEDYVMATAFRQGMIQYMFTWILQLPLALIFPFPSMSVHNQMNTVYQFWCHTELVGPLGPLEYILNTPTHHRSHHHPPGNCNYAGVLIIWDRIFGTFVSETQRVDNYGLAKSPESFDTLELNVQHLRKWRRIPHTSELKHLLATRAKHMWSYCRPSAMFERLPKNPDGWEMPQGKPKRDKYEGADLGPLRKLLVILLLLFGAFAQSAQPGSARKSKNPKQMKCLLGVASILSLSSAGKLLDSGEARFSLREAGFMSAILAATAAMQSR